LKKIKICKVFVLTLILVLLVSSASFAQQPFNNPNKEKKLSILKIVEKYSPQTLEDWKQVLKERIELKKRLIGYKKEIIDSKKSFNKKYEFIKDLKAKVENQEMSKEEAKKRIKEYKVKCKGTKKYHLNKYNSELYTLKRDLYKAVSEKDEEKVKAILDKLYVKYQEANKGLREKIK